MRKWGSRLLLERFRWMLSVLLELVIEPLGSVSVDVGGYDVVGDAEGVVE